MVRVYRANSELKLFANFLMLQTSNCWAHR
nr:MAG TPA: hypothetical protein [Caudoviricetes sp.]